MHPLQMSILATFKNTIGALLIVRGMKRLEFASIYHVVHYLFDLRDASELSELPGLPDAYFRIEEQNAYFVHYNTEKEMQIQVDPLDCARFEAYIQANDPWTDRAWPPRKSTYWYDGRIHTEPKKME